jgi:hypothetical protein
VEWMTLRTSRPPTLVVSRGADKVIEEDAS